MDNFPWHIRHFIDSDQTSYLHKIEEILLQDRNLTLDPPSPTLASLRTLPDLSPDQLDQAVQLIKVAIQNHTPILIYGDYDCDGVCATAILYQTLIKLTPTVHPFIPHRQKHGYGLSSAGIKDALAEIKQRFPGTPLVVTVDNGISATKEIKSLKKTGAVVIVVDHHLLPDTPPPSVNVHSTLVCASTLSLLLASSLEGQLQPIELAALATVTDQVPLLGINRSLVLHGLKSMRLTKNIGLKALIDASLPAATPLDTYHLGFILGPRINAAGRLDHALIALRLLLTQDSQSAQRLVARLGDINQLRQDHTTDHVAAAVTQFSTQTSLPPILLTSSPDYHEGIIGLIAAKLSETFRRPAIAVSMGDVLKGSARSIKGVDITATLRSLPVQFNSLGGHEQAAGFSLDPHNLTLLTDSLAKLNLDLPQNLLDIDIALKPLHLTHALYQLLSRFAPFGAGNPEPLLAIQTPVKSTRLVGSNKQHLQFRFDQAHFQQGIAFNQPTWIDQIIPGQPLGLAFHLKHQIYQGNSQLSLQVRHITYNWPTK